MTPEYTRPRAVPRHVVALRLRQALDGLLQHDAALLDFDVSERAVAHRVAVHLNELFCGWNVDCEYNRKGADCVAKTLNWHPWMHPLDEPPKVFPDIVVHRRGEEDDNILVIEIKKSTSRRSDADDMRKLAAYTRPRSENGLGYEHGAFVRINVCVGSPSYEIAKWFPEIVIGGA